MNIVIPKYREINAFAKLFASKKQTKDDEKYYKKLVADTLKNKIKEVIILLCL